MPTYDWYQTFPTGTPDVFRARGQMAYDRDRGRLVVYGGTNVVSGALDAADVETWELYGGAWHQVTTANYPLGNGGFPASDGWMVYDEARQVMVLCIVFNAPSPQTWTYDGTDWTNTGAVTPNRPSSAAVWDPINDQIVMWGGSNTAVADTTYYTWDGTAWSSHTTAAAPLARDQHAMAYDRTNNNIVMYGGYTGVLGNLRPDDTWTLDLSGTPNWTQRFPASPPDYGGTGAAGENIGGLTYDEALNQVVQWHFLAAPLAAFSSTWLWDGTEWDLVNSATAPPVSPTANGTQITWDAEYGKTLGYGGVGAETWLFPFVRRFRPQIYRRR